MNSDVDSWGQITKVIPMIKFGCLKLELATLGDRALLDMKSKSEVCWNQDLYL